MKEKEHKLIKNNAYPDHVAVVSYYAIHDALLYLSQENIFSGENAFGQVYLSSHHLYSLVYLQIRK